MVSDLLIIFCLLTDLFVFSNAQSNVLIFIEAIMIRIEIFYELILD